MLLLSAAMTYDDEHTPKGRKRQRPDSYANVFTSEIKDEYGYDIPQDYLNSYNVNFEPVLDLLYEHYLVETKNSLKEDDYHLDTSLAYIIDRHTNRGMSICQ